MCFKMEAKNRIYKYWAIWSKIEKDIDTRSRAEKGKVRGLMRFREISATLQYRALEDTVWMYQVKGFY